jgi:hypothetical protein
MNKTITTSSATVESSKSIGEDWAPTTLLQALSPYLKTDQELETQHPPSRSGRR